MSVAKTPGEPRIAYEAVGSGSPVLLVQGLGYPRWGWEPVVERLQDGFLVVSFDNRGIGESDVPPGPYTAAGMAEDGVAVLDAAGIERAHVVGASLGGMIAQELVLAHPERVDRLALICTTPGGAEAYPLPEPTLRLLAEAPSLAPQDALRLFIENAMVARGALVDELYARRLASPPDPAGWQAQAAAGALFDAYDRVPLIAAPTLVLQGGADTVIDPRNGDLLVELIPNARLEAIPDRGHLMVWEEGAMLAPIVKEFLES
ncbi:MAG: alpha/beta fold hydrolase [Gaiellaceae bacterium]